MRLWPNGSSDVPTVTAEYGVPHPVTGYHRGIDLIGFPVVLAADAGEVFFAGYNSSAGNEVVIRHDDGYFTRSMHLDSLYVDDGQRVGITQPLGEMGATGAVTGVHVHFEVVMPDAVTRINPRDYIGTTPPVIEPKGKHMRYLIQIDPATDGRWFLADYGTGTAHRIYNGLQLDLIRRDPYVNSVAGPQTIDAIAGLTVTGE
jgi:hypothetical protein